MNLQKFNTLFNTDLESSEVDTIGGYMIEEAGYFPEDDEKLSVRVGPYLLTTSKVESGRIRSIHVERKPQDEENENE